LTSKKDKIFNSPTADVARQIASSLSPSSPDATLSLLFVEVVMVAEPRRFTYCSFSFCVFGSFYDLAVGLFYMYYARFDLGLPPAVCFSLPLFSLFHCFCFSVWDGYILVFLDGREAVDAVRRPRLIDENIKLY